MACKHCLEKYLDEVPYNENIEELSHLKDYPDYAKKLYVHRLTGVVYMACDVLDEEAKTVADSSGEDAFVDDRFKFVTHDWAREYLAKKNANHPLIEKIDKMKTKAQSITSK